MKHTEDSTEKTIPTTNAIQNEGKTIRSKTIGIHQNSGKNEQNENAKCAKMCHHKTQHEPAPCPC
eukprot:3844651-Amphidinium_carterae.1